MTTRTLPNTILTHFSHWTNIACWVVCNDKKQPCDKRTGLLAKWRTDPKDNIITLTELETLCELEVVERWGGFGIILGQDNHLCCIDFDHILDNDGNITNPEVAAFIEDTKTFVEKSSGGHGLHAFFLLESPHEEYSLRKSFCDGKFYVDRFIKMTGNVYKEYDYPVRTIREHGFNIIKSRIGEPEAELENSKTDYTGDNTETWESILGRAGIPIVQSNYSGKVRRGKLVIESWRIECPNRAAHRTDRQGDPSAHLAVLNKYTDGSTSVSCSHNSCSPQRHPNLLQKLWDKVKVRARKNKLLTAAWG
jgi:hypothetical protein